MADQLYDHLLHDFNPERRAAVRAFLEQTSRDQRLVAQLTPEGIDVFNAAATDRDGVRYYSVVTIAPRPGLRSAARIGLDPYGQATHALFAALHRLAGRSGDAVAAEASVPQRAELQRALGSLPGPRDNDGIVPTWSQPWGEVVSAARADHLDVIGHFDATDDSAPETHYDWFASGAGFDRDAFEALWDQIAARLLPA